MKKHLCALIILPIALGASGAAAAALTDDLVAYWSLDEGTDSTAADTATSGSFADDGTLADPPKNPSWIAGKLGGALSFDGSDDFVDIPNSVDLDIGANAVTISLWVKLDTLPADLTASFASIYDSAGDAYVVYLDKGSNELRFKTTDSGGMSGRPGVPAVQLNTTEWHHVVGVYDGANSEARIYWDSVLAGTDTAGSGPVKTGQVATLGRNGTFDETYLPGDIDDIGVWSRVLTQPEIDEIFNGGVGKAILGGVAIPAVSLFDLLALTVGLATLGGWALISRR